MQLAFNYIKRVFLFTKSNKIKKYLETRKPLDGAPCNDVPGECDEAKGLVCLGKPGEKKCG